MKSIITGLTIDAWLDAEGRRLGESDTRKSHSWKLGYLQEQVAHIVSEPKALRQFTVKLHTIANKQQPTITEQTSKKLV